MKLFSRKNRKEKGMEIINSHCGKKQVYKTYLKENPSLAEKYLEFISRNIDAIYIWWDQDRQRFCA